MLLALSNVVFATTNCMEHYKNGIPPIEVVEHTNTIEICFEGYAVLYSLDDKIPLWSSETMSVESLNRGKGIARHDDFHAEQRIPPEHRAVLSDYAGSGYDRGHLTPYKDIPWDKDIDSLSNIVPQSPALNRGAWSRLESSVRKNTHDGEIKNIVTGAICDKSKFIGNNVCVPTHMYKVVTTNETAVFAAKNENTAVVERWTVEELQEKTGFDFSNN